MKHREYKPSNGIDFDKPVYAPFLNEARFSTLTKERERELIAKAKIEITSLEAKLGKSITELITGDAPLNGLNGNSSENDYPALNEIVERNLKFIAKFAPEIGCRYGLDGLESISEAHFAIYRAVKGYNPENKNPETNEPDSLSNYIIQWIIGSLHNSSRKNQRLSGGESFRLQIRKIRRITESLFESKGYKPSIEEIVDELNKTAKPICTVDQLREYDTREYSSKSRILLLRMLEKPENLPFDPHKILKDFAIANKTETTDLIRLLEFPNVTHLENRNKVFKAKIGN